MESVIAASLKSDLSPTVLEREFMVNELHRAEDRVAASASNLRRAHTVAQGRNIANTNTGVSAARGQVATSILRAKDSHEVLPKRPARRFDIPQLSRDTLAGGREPNHFTVGNVGQNGKIFLRPIQNPSHKEHHLPPPFLPPTARSQDERFLLPTQCHSGNGPSRWSNSQLSELRPEFIPEEGCEDADSTASEPALSEDNRHHHPRQRAQSFSTISEQRSVSGAQRHGEFRISIDRTDDRPRSADDSLRPTLDTPIPHYRLGTLRFNTEGSAALHSSIYSRTSFSDNFRVSGFLAESYNASTGSHAYLGDALQSGRPSFAASVFSGQPAMGLSRNSAATVNPIFYELKEPIEPAVFEHLSSKMDHESVVRYIAGTKDIGAATPARLVAQISSESFMDYELVSDFFLTFRSYLSSGSLLALLLARLQWAINRLQDDGRIIRIRTFAALRHWILNYFADDFVPDHSLRTHFCETINTMYDNVKAREGGGMSDLKILIDLKRCWHGKCAGYWEWSPEHIVPDTAISPGGSTLETIPLIDFRNEYQDTIQHERGHALRHGGQEVLPIVQQIRHDRNNSTVTARSMPVSTQSDNSVQVTSCSLPPKSPKRLSVPVAASKAPHPVPIIPPKFLCSLRASPNASPIIAKRHPSQSHTHKRSGSFSDSVRDDRSPLSPLKLEQQTVFSSREVLNLGSLIRGELYAPAESYMTMLAPPSPPLPSSVINPAIDRRSTLNEGSKPPTSSSGMKTIIGSIRRVLHSRNGQSISARAMNGHWSPTTRGKTSTLPNNVAFGSDLYRDKRSAANPKRPMRIDILCDEAMQQYRRAMGEVETPRTAKTPGLEISEQIAAFEHAQPSHRATHFDHSRAKSQITMGSQSIVIVDDTGTGGPVMSGAVMAQTIGLERSPGFLDAADTPTTVKASSLRVPSQRTTLAEDQYSLPIYYDEADHAPPNNRISRFLRGSGLSDSRRSFSVERFSASWKRTSPSLRLRKYASFQSEISRQRSAMAQEWRPPGADTGNPETIAEKQVGPTLRRRPGGDLRQMRNGGAALSRPASGSYASSSTYRSSFADSMISRANDGTSRPQTTLIPPNPRYELIQTHSSQIVRRSFEAAIAQFAQIPDDDDGGIESALLKLEGKWPGSPITTGSDAGSAELLQRSQDPRVFRQSDSTKSGIAGRRHHTLLGNNPPYSQVRPRLAPPRSYSDSITSESGESYSSIPLLERGLSDESMKKSSLDRIAQYPVMPPRSELDRSSTRNASDVESSHPSIDIFRKTDSLECIPRESTLPVPMPERLRARGERLSGLSSGISVDVTDAQEVLDQRLSLDTQSLADGSFEIPPHPLAHPPSPPMTIPNPRSVASCTAPMDSALFPAQPLTPDPSPRHRNGGRHNIRSVDMRQVSGDVLSRSEEDRQNHDLPTSADLDHIPFILSCQSQVLAQQLTLVEMAALSEVDWRDLVDMKWSSGSPSTQNWVQFLTDEERRGIDLVVGRFNLMVRWVVSEVILVRRIEERASTIIKFIHTAAHAKRICNYATMLQIAIALSSTDCSRLHKTWALVPPSDRRLLQDMELLIQPVRNFHDLRTEMETANLQEGCIPFVGLYVHDLTYNAQKPAQVANPAGEPLVNFERYRTAAKIVKSLLRLIDASTKYKFEPVPGIIERCLWIASLSEEQIQKRSRLLE
ncbi:mitotic regulator LTE1 [Aspergillus clavatus NRRL 1]|uniref:Low temperature essential 1, lte1 n=1 Tax=Aspergillus clavatus (strain ATCC 1007 / CBS 513.65 / DSM 816 / NCTC 3887 / NRRL 1 / QM 1276 / 107) TaxID=344612 RepID=A1CKY8_ASPCL|nr:low temperature essential 1, lte1 [Aspergillus clavatus NRRL 1]EAW09812.1 low temperature essential 1, lte1 [Aspergillus clavatus NRRL 1]